MNNVKKLENYDEISKISKNNQSFDEIIENKQLKVVNLKCRVLKIEIVVIILITIMTLAELILAITIYTSYTSFTNLIFYETLMFYVRNVDYIFQLKQISNSTCPDGYDEFNMQQIKSIEGICLFKDKQTGRNKMSYNSSLGNCTSTTLNLDKTITVNYWANSFYCKKSYSMVDVKFYFTKNECSSDLILGTFKKNCGNYFGYNYCLSTSLQSFNETVCPFMNMVRDDNKPNKTYPSDLTQVFKFNTKNLYMMRLIDDSITTISRSFFSIRLVYGDVRLPNSTEDYLSNFISYYRKQYIEISNPHRISILKDDVDSDNFNQFLTIYLHSKIIESYGDLDIIDYPVFTFSVRYKRNYLPNKNCIEYFSFENTGTDYIGSFQLFLNHVEISVTRYFGYVIMELLYILSFFVYYRGVLIYYDLSSKDHVLRFYSDHEEVSSNTRIIFSTLILFFKLFTNLIQYFNLNNNLKFATTILNENCFPRDTYMNESLNVYITMVPYLQNMTFSCIFVMAFSYLTIILFTLFENSYLNTKKIYLDELKEVRDKDRDKKKKTKTN